MKKTNTLYSLIFLLVVSMLFLSCGGSSGGDESGTPGKPEPQDGPIDIDLLLGETSAAEVGVVLARSTGIDHPFYIQEYVSGELGIPLTLSDVENCSLILSDIPDLDCNGVSGTQADAGILLAILLQIQSPYAVSNYVNNQLGITVPLLNDCPLPSIDNQGGLGRLTLLPKTMIVNEATLLDVNVRTTISDIDSGLELLLLNSEGSVLYTLGELYDDGDPSKGDSVAADGIFSNRFNLTFGTPGTWIFAVRSPLHPDEQAIGSISVVELINAAALDQAEDLGEQVEQMFSTLTGSGQMTPEAAMAELVNFLTASAIVEPDSVKIVGDAVHWQTIEGVKFIFIANQEPGYHSSAFSAGENHQVLSRFEGDRSVSPCCGGIKATSSSHSVVCNSAKAFGYAPYYKEFGEWDETVPIVNMLKDAGYTINNIKTTWASPSLESLKGLEVYDVIAIGSHGAQGFGTIPSCMDSGVLLTASNKDEMRRLRSKKEIAFLRAGGKTSIGVYPSFFDAHTGDMNGSMIYASWCFSTQMPNFSSVFLSKGASVFLGYSNAVNSKDSLATGVQSFNELISGTPVGLLSKVNKVVGYYRRNPVYFNFFGDVAATISAPNLSNDSIKNGGFETGTFQCWDHSEGWGYKPEIAPSFKTIDAAEGTNMAVLYAGSNIGQPFKVAEENTVLSFVYDILINRDLRYLDDNYKFFSVFVVVSTDPTLSADKDQTFINEENWYLTDFGICDWPAAEKPVKRTGFKYFSMDLSSFKGKNVYLTIVAAPGSGDLSCGDILLLDQVFLHKPGEELPELTQPTEEPYDIPDPEPLPPYEPPPSPTGPGFVIQFEDPFLEAAVRRAIQKPTGVITYGDVNYLTALDAQGSGLLFTPSERISSIKGIEYLIRLETLDLRRNRINDLRPLAGLSELRYLNLYSNDIKDIDPLKNLSNLLELDLGSNVNLFDFSALASLPGLTKLVLRLTPVSDLSFLESVKNLHYFDISSSYVRDLAPLAYLTNLTELYAGDIEMKDLNIIFGLKSLQRLYLGNGDFYPPNDNLFTDISLLAALSDLTHLSLSGTGVANIQALEGLTELTYVDLDGNQIVYIDPLVSNPGIDDGDYIILSDNPLDDESLYSLIPILEGRGVTVQLI